mgnify:CR=1 FL=1
MNIVLNTVPLFFPYALDFLFILRPKSLRERYVLEPIFYKKKPGLSFFEELIF